MPRIDKTERGGAGKRGFAHATFAGEENKLGQVREHELFSLKSDASSVIQDQQQPGDDFSTSLICSQHPLPGAAAGPTD